MSGFTVVGGTPPSSPSTSPYVTTPPGTPPPPVRDPDRLDIIIPFPGIPRIFRGHRDETLGDVLTRWVAMMTKLGFDMGAVRFRYRRPSSGRWARVSRALASRTLGDLADIPAPLIFKPY